MGKTTVSANLAAKLAEKFRVAFIDLDIYGPNAHLLLGLPEVPAVEYGEMLMPPKVKVNGRSMQFMSMAMFMPEGVGLAIRAEYVLDIIRTITEFTRWDCDLIVVDMPPGSQDVVNYTLGLVAPRAEAILVTEPHKMSLSDCFRLYDILKLKEVNLAAVVLNKYNLFKGAGEFERIIKSVMKVPIVKVDWTPELQDGLKPGLFEDLAEVVL